MNLNKYKKYALLAAVLTMCNSGAVMAAGPFQEFSTVIQGSADEDKEYVEAGVLQGERYVFSENTLIKTKGNGINAKYRDINIIAEGKELDLSSQCKTPGVGGLRAAISSGDRKVTIKADSVCIGVNSEGSWGSAIHAGGLGTNSGYVDITGDVKIRQKSTGTTMGIYVQGGSALNINGNLEAEVRKIRDENFALARYYNAAVYAGFGPSKVDISGDVKVKSNGTGVEANAGAVIDIKGGGSVKIDKHSGCEHYALESEASTIYWNVAHDDAEGNISVAGDRKVAVQGNIGLINKDYGSGPNSPDAPTEISLALVTEKSSFKGVVYNQYKEQKRSNGNVTLYLQNGAKWNNASWGKVKDDFTGSKITNLIGGEQNNPGIIYQQDEGDIVVDNYSGNLTVVYDHDAEKTDTIKGGNFIINKAAAGSNICLITDNDGLAVTDDYKVKEDAKAEDKNAIAATMNALANKVFYKECLNNESLSGTVEIAEGLTTKKKSMTLFRSAAAIEKPVAGDSLKGDITWNKEEGDKLGQGRYIFDKAVDEVKPDPKPNPNPEPKPDPDPNPNPEPKPDPDPKPNPEPKPDPDPKPNPEPKPEVKELPTRTHVISAVESAMTTSMLAWRSDLTDMTERMGDLRNADEAGLWASVTGGKLSYEKDNNEFKNEFKGVHVGLDKKLVGGWYVGGAFNYMDGDAKYEQGGKGDNKLYGLTAYGSKLNDDGSYFDVTAKVNRVENDYNVYTEMFHHKVNGDYKTNGYGFSVEYGKRIEAGKNWYEPQVQLSFGRLNAKDYTADTDYKDGRTLNIHQDAMNSVVGRIGIAAGTNTEKGSFYAKADLLHEFSGDMTSSTFNSALEGDEDLKFDREFDDTWTELSLGGTYNLSDVSYFYADVARSFGGSYGLDWKVNAGLRFSF